MNKIKSTIIVVLLALVSFSSSPSFSQAASLENVPGQLLPWVDWVLNDEKQIDCPYRYNSSGRMCAWPSRLQLDLDETGGRFVQQWQLFSESLIQLPGEAKHWPLKVSSNNEELLVQSVDGSPHVRLAKGNHTIRGEFSWHKLPKSLFITPGSGLVALTVNKRPVAQAQFDQQGQLWLMQSDGEKISEDNIDLQVFRRVFDGHPVKVETLIKLRVSGKQRNSAFESVLLNDFIATDIKSDLPARLEGSNQLMVQLRPGEWSITVTGRALGDVQAFTMPEIQEPWPQQEVWVFVSDNNMRQVQVEGVNSIDPNQTRLPNDWKGLPAYLLAPNQTLSLNIKERGINNLARNELNLVREMWLDFDGQGYSIKDQINGVIQQSRIDVLPSIELGRVSISQQPQFITRETDKEVSGVEVRQKFLNLSAESRFTGKHTALPANGWGVDIQKVDTKLHIPPGWRVLGVSGTDNLPNTWLEKWSLLDLFLAMIIVMSVRHFYGWRWAGLALTTLVFTWQEGGAPNLIWLNLLAITALLAVLPKHKYSHWLEKYRLASFAVLAVILLSYTIDTIRVSVHPQLERGYTQQWQSAKQLEMDLQQRNQRLQKKPNRSNLATSAAVEEVVVTASKFVNSGRAAYSQAPVDLKKIDPNSMIQSGPGLPSWNGYQTIRMSWAGPVKADQTSRLILLSPKANFVVRILGIALLMGLTWCFFRSRPDDDEPNKRENKNISLFTKWLKSPTITAILLLPLLLPLISPNNAQAQAIPSPEILATLKQRLTKAPDCLGACAQIQRMSTNVTINKLQLRLRVHALSSTAIPLPASQGTWLPSQILLNGKPATALTRDANQVVWLRVDKGLHDVLLSGPMLQRVSFPLSLPLAPNFSTWASDDNSWTIEGIDEDGVTKTQLQFTRVVSQGEQPTFESDDNSLPTFVKVERQLRLGLDWYVQTTVERISPKEVPLNINIPLLANEQLLDDQLRVENGAVAVSFTANQSQVSWSSKLASRSDMQLTAVSNPSYLEVWSIDASPVWRVKAQGLPVSRYLSQASNQTSGQQRVVPVWQPWPGETLSLKIERPIGVTGQTVTLQGSQLSVNAGKRVNDINLNLSIRSSRGIQHQIKLPDNAEVQEVLLDNIKQRVQLDNKLLSVMLKPGKQDLSVKWREPNPQSMRYVFPTVDLQLPSVNAHTSIRVPRDRWVVWVDGPVLGPAILFWSVLGALLILSAALGWSKLTPLTTVQWFVLAIGLSQTSPTLIAVVAACIIGLSLREKLTKTLSRLQFNFMQVGLIVLIVASLSIIVAAVANGLLGSPDMQVAGNGSNSSLLKWYQDRATAILPQPDVVSVPLWVYRVLMLAWALWLAMSLLKWIKWGWQALSSDGFWRGKPKPEPVDNTTPEVQEP